MTKTQNYQLNQWEPTDKLSRADFNSDNAAIDAALAAKAEKSAVSAVETALASKANNSAVTAVETALTNYKTSNDAAVASAQSTANSAAAKADAAYSSSNSPFSFVTVDTTGMVSGDTVYTFERAPQFVILQGECACGALVNGMSATLMDDRTPSISSIATFQLSGTSLILKQRVDETIAVSVTIISYG